MSLLDGKDDNSVDKDKSQKIKSHNHFRFGQCKTTQKLEKQ